MINFVFTKFCNIKILILKFIYFLFSLNKSYLTVVVLQLKINIFFFIILTFIITDITNKWLIVMKPACNIKVFRT